MTAFGHRFMGFLAVFMALWFLGGFDHFPRGIVASLVTLVSAAFSATIPALLFAWLAGLIQGRVVVGTDGFVTRWLFRERFVPFSKVAAVHPEKRVTQREVIDTVVELTSGRKLRLRPLEVPNTEVERGSEGRALYTHLAAAFERSKQASSAMPNVQALVQRGSRSTREWLSGIDGLVGGGGARYRVAQLSSDSLLAVATDPNASVDARVGAAAALIRTNDDDLRVRVRVCAESCTDRALREAMLALSEARDDDATETALAGLRL